MVFLFCMLLSFVPFVKANRALEDIAATGRGYPRFVIWIICFIGTAFYAVRWS